MASNRFGALELLKRFGDVNTIGGKEAGRRTQIFKDLKGGDSKIFR